MLGTLWDTPDPGAHILPPLPMRRIDDMQEQAMSTIGERNHLLRTLAPADYDRLRPHLEPTALPLGMVISAPDAPVSHVHFPRCGIISMVKEMADGGTVEVATVGNEGLVGLPAFLGTGSAPVRAFVQVAGESVRVDAATFAALAEECAGLRRSVHRHVQALMNQMAQTAACNRVHTVEERLARWLLMAHDRAGGDEIPLTQHFMAEMLGVRRAGVSVAAGALQKAGMIAYRRGKIAIVDRAALETASCECYAAVRAQTERLFSAAAS